jgi:hypothetical protein
MNFIDVYVIIKATNQVNNINVVYLVVDGINKCLF